MIKSHLDASTTPQAAHTERLYKQAPLSFYVKGKHQKASQATLENHPEGSNGDLGRRASGFITTARRTARPPAHRAARPPTGPGEAGSRTRQALRPSADRRAARRPGQAAPETADAGLRRRSPGPAVHGHMSLRGRRRRTPAPRLGRAAQSGGRPTAPSAASRGQHRGDAAPTPAPASRFPRPGPRRRRLGHFPRTRKSSGGGRGARGRALRLHLAARPAGGTCPPAVLGTGSRCSRPGKALLSPGSHITTSIHSKFRAQVGATASASLQLWPG